jgi:carboxyl-terminal processing protease
MSDFLNDFAVAWQTVNEKHFDPTYGGLNWDGLVYPTLFAEGSIGIDVRLLDAVGVIKSVAPESPGARAGLRPGFVIQSIDGILIEQIAAERLAHLEPPYNQRMKRTSITSEILSRIYGPPETNVSIGYVDTHEATHETNMVRQSRENKSESTHHILPPMFLEFEATRFDNGIGYIRFNSFHQALATDISRAIRLLNDVPGLIIDVRGNCGGDSRVGIALAEQLVKEHTLFWRAKARDRTADACLDPTENAYEGPLAVLIDVMSQSGSEIFAAGIQAVGRGVIVGVRSPGVILVADGMKLPNGASFLYPIMQISTPDGTLLEGRGVVPDIEVGLDRDLLMQGVDSQLEAAIRYLEKEQLRD